MYGKIFSTIYDGTLYGQWEAIVTFQQLIVLCDADGVIDMTPPAIAARTSIPIEIIEKGLKILSEPDPYSRTEGHEGKRIALLDDHRPWGWYIINYLHYRQLQSHEQKREKARIRKQRQREREKADNGDVTPCHAVSRMSRHRDRDRDIKERKTLSGKPDGAREKSKQNRETARRVLAFLNQKAHKAFRENDTNIDLVVSRLKDGATEQELRQVIARKCREWSGDPKSAAWLRPKTLFRKSNYETYTGELVATE